MKQHADTCFAKQMDDAITISGEEWVYLCDCHHADNSWFMRFMRWLWGKP